MLNQIESVQDHVDDIARFGIEMFGDDFSEDDPAQWHAATAAAHYAMAKEGFSARAVVGAADTSGLRAALAKAVRAFVAQCTEYADVDTLQKDVLAAFRLWCRHMGLPGCASRDFFAALKDLQLDGVQVGRFGSRGGDRPRMVIGLALTQETLEALGG